MDGKRAANSTSEKGKNQIRQSQKRTLCLGFTDVSEKPSFFFTVPARNPRPLCCCQSVACIISAMLAPLGWLNRVSTRSCLVTRSTFSWSIFTGVLAAATRSAFDSTDRGGFLAVAAVDGTLRRDAV